MLNARYKEGPAAALAPSVATRVTAQQKANMIEGGRFGLR
jgi:hypothetical protein